jgi:hypothetical protein
MSPEQIQAQRDTVIAEAMSWRETKFHHRAAVKGAGVDCMMFPAATFTVALGARFAIPPYSPQWHLHAEPKDSAIFKEFPAYMPVGQLWNSGEDGFRELYIEGVLAGGFIEISGNQQDVEPFDSGCYLDASFEKADLVIVKLGHVYAHGAIILDWPKIIQAESSPYGAGKVVVSTTEANWYFSNRPLKFFSWKAWH